MRVLAALDSSEPEEWAIEHDLRRYFGSSLKGEAGIDWDDAEARGVFLGGVVTDAERLLEVARRVKEKLPSDEPLRQQLHEATELLSRLLLQDIERQADGVSLKQGVSPERIVSVHDPEMRHGRKSANKRFDGHKGKPTQRLVDTYMHSV